MCRLFGLHAGADPVKATFWLLKAPDSLSLQSRREPDGTGIGTFGPNGVPAISKQAIAAFEDPEFATAARELKSRTFVAHVRYATTGALTEVNTHPFEQDGRIFAHNGAFGELDALDARLAELHGADLVLGQTDSERMFALITLETRRHDGDLQAGIAAALAWISLNLPVYSLNLVIATATELWALRYPDTHELYVLERAPGGRRRSQPLKLNSNRIHGHSQDLAGKGSVVIATEPMDRDPGWRLLESGELLHIDTGLNIHSSRPLPRAPARLLLLEPPSAVPDGGVNLPGKIMIYSHPPYTGEATMELNLAVHKVSEYMDEHTNVFARGHYTIDSSQFSVSIAKPNDVAVQGLRDLVAQLDPENRIFLFENVERSIDDLKAIQMAIVYEFMIDDPNGSDHGLLARKGTSIQGVGIVDSPSRVVVDVLKDSNGLPLDANEEVQAINTKYPGAVMFAEVSSVNTVDSSDGHIAPPWPGPPR